MFNPTQIVIAAFVRELREMYDRTYGTLEPEFPGVMSFVAQLALENIATSDAPYHDANHTIMVTLVARKSCGAGTSALAVCHRATGCTSPSRCYATTSAMCEESARPMKTAGTSPIWRAIGLPCRKAPLMRR